MIKFIHTADIHLGLQFENVSFSKDKAIDRRRELWSTFERIVMKSKEEKIDFLFIAGDLFEAKYFTLGDMKKLRDLLLICSSVNVIISAGNHDFIDRSSLYNKVEWSPNVTIFGSNGLEKKEFKELNTVIFGYSWDKIEIKENQLLKDIHFDNNMNKILIIHGEVSINSNYLPLDLDSLKALNMDYIALGHIHKPIIIADNIAYCGSPEPLDFGEIGDRGIIVGEIKESITKIEFIPFSKRRFFKIDIELDEDMGYGDILNKIKHIDFGTKDLDFYRVYLKGYIQSDMDFTDIKADLEEYFYHIELVNNTLLNYDLESLELANKNNIIGQFIFSMKSKGLENEVVKDALYLGLAALMKGRVS